jgi:bile acid:Na+ symporter, BASS family
MTPQAIIGLVLKVSIILTVFGFGLQASRDDLLYLWRRPRLLVRSLVAMFVVMPLFVLLMTSIASFDRAVLVALVALSISPIPPLLPRKVTKSTGLASYGLGLMVTAASLSIVLIPLASYLLGKYFHRDFIMGPGAVAKLILPSVLIPIAAGVLFRRLAPSIAKRIGHPLARIAGIMLLLGVICILAFTAPAVWSLVGNGTILAFVAFILLGLAAGHLLAGPGPDEQVALALSTACRHPALAVAIAAASIPEEHHVFAAVLLYVLLNVVLTIPYVSWQRKRVQALQTSHQDLSQ